MAINLPNGLLKLLGIDPSTIEISLSEAGNSFNGTNANEHILGNGGGDSINAKGGSDIVEGGEGGDSITGGDGNDYVEGGAGGDSLNGGAGSNGGIDTVGYSLSASGVTITLNSGGGGQASGGDAQGDSIGGFENVVGSLFADRITGNNSANVLAGLAGNDKLYGMGGNDILIGGLGADELYGGDGLDTADYSTSPNPVHLLLGGVSSGGDAQGDKLFSIEKLVGTAGADVFDGSASLAGFSADGGGGADTMIGGHGNDHLSIGGAAAAVAGFAALQEEGGTLDGGEGNDELVGGDGDDTENGGEGNDLISGGGGNDSIDGGDGDDEIDGGDGDDIIYDGNGNDTASGGEGNDTFIVGSGQNSLDGGNGNDSFNLQTDSIPASSDGSVAFNGGEGPEDSMDLRNLSSGVEVTLQDPSASLAAFEDSPYLMDMTFGSDVRKYTRFDIESDILTEFDDRFFGNSVDNVVLGQGGNDIIHGGGGNDTLVGGDGNDFLYAGFGAGGNETLYGGFGADQFAFGSVEEVSSAFTFIQDFNIDHSDLIDLSFIDANTTIEEDDAFHWIGDGEFSGTAGELRFKPGTGELENYNIIEGDVDGIGEADIAFLVNKLPAGDPTAEFFVL